MGPRKIVKRMEDGNFVFRFEILECYYNVVWCLFQCFYFMQNRVRKSVEMIRQCDSSVKNNLSDLDYKIYTLSPSGSSVAQDELLNDDEYYGGCAVKEKKQNADNIDDYVLEDNFINNWALTDDELVGGNKDNLNEFRDDGSAPRVLVVQSMEELVEYENTSMIVDEEESIHETDDVIYASKSDGGLNDYKSCKPSSSNLNVRVIERESNESSQLQYNVPQKPPSKPNPRIPEVQKERLVQLIQNNFTKAFGRFTGTDGAHIKNNLWQTIAKELNTLGPPRTADQWKAVSLIYFYFLSAIHSTSSSVTVNFIDFQRYQSFSKVQTR